MPQQYTEEELESAYVAINDGKIDTKQLTDDAISQLTKYIGKRNMPVFAKGNAEASAYLNRNNGTGGVANATPSVRKNADMQLQDEIQSRSNVPPRTSTPNQQSISNPKPNYDLKQKMQDDYIVSGLMRFGPVAREQMKNGYVNPTQPYFQQPPVQAKAKGKTYTEEEINAPVRKWRADVKREQKQNLITDLAQKTLAEKVNDEEYAKNNPILGNLAIFEKKTGMAARSALSGDMSTYGLPVSPQYQTDRNKVEELAKKSLITEDQKNELLNAINDELQNDMQNITGVYVDWHKVKDDVKLSPAEQINIQKDVYGSNLGAELLGTAASFAGPSGISKFAGASNLLAKSLQGASGKTGFLANKIASMLSKSPKALQAAVNEVIPGAFFGGSAPLLRGEDPFTNPGDFLKEAGMGAAFGAGFGAAGSVIGSGISKLISKLTKKQQEQIIQLTLPPGQKFEELPAPSGERPFAQTNDNFQPIEPNKRSSATKTPDIIQQKGNPILEYIANELRKPLGLPEGILPKQSRVKLVSRAKEVQQYYENKWNDFVTYVNKKYESKGRFPTQEEVVSEWSQVAERNDPNIFTVLELAFPDKKPLSSQAKDVVSRFGEGVIVKAKERQRMRDIAGLPPILKSQKPAQPEGNPLQFKKEVFAFANGRLPKKVPTNQSNIPTQTEVNNVPNNDVTVSIPSPTKFQAPQAEVPQMIKSQDRINLENKVLRYFPNEDVSKLSQKDLEDLGYEIDKQTSGVKTYQFDNQSKLANSPIENSPKSTTNEFKNFDSPKNEITNKVDVKNDIQTELKRIDNELQIIDSEYEQAVIDMANGLKAEYDNRGGIRIVPKEDGIGNIDNDRSTRVSDNPVWYQKYYPIINKSRWSKADFEWVARDMMQKGDNEFFGGTPFDELSGLKEKRDSLLEVRKYLEDELNANQNKSESTNQVNNNQALNSKTIDQTINEASKRTNDVIKGQEQQLGILPNANRVSSGIKMKDVRSSDPQVEASLVATKTLRQSIAEKTKDIAKAPIEAAKKLFQGYFQYRSELKDMPTVRNDFRKAEGISQDARDYAEKILSIITNGLRDKTEFEVFKRVIMLKDFEQELLALRKVPNDLELRQVQDELDRLMNFVSKNKGLQVALQNHDDIMKAIGNDLVKRGKLDQQSVKDNYYPHRVLDYVTELDKTSGGLNSIKSPYRFYTKQREGSEKLIESDYIKVMFNALYKVKLDNSIDDFVYKILQNHNAMNKLSSESKSFKLMNDGQTVELSDGNRYSLFNFNKKDYLIDERIYKNLKDFKGKGDLSPGLELGQKFTSWWKRITLDFAGLTFHWTNFMGDMLALYRDDPMALTKIPKAIKMMIQDASNLNAVDQNVLRLAKKQRIFQSGITEGSLGKLFPNKPINNQFVTTKDKWLYRINPFNIIENISNVRESIPRMAKFLKDVERIQNGKMVKSNVLDVKKLKAQGLKDIDVAGKVTREGFIDYGFLSKHAQAEFRGFLFPFFTFYEQNFKNWAKYLIKHPADLTLKFGVPFGAMMYWNNSGDRKQLEDQLPDYIKDSPHIITGFTNEDGKPYVLTFNTPLNAAEQTFALNKLPNRIKDVVQGKEPLSQALMDQTKDTLMGPIKTGAGLLNPALKVPVEIYSNKNFLTGGSIAPERLPSGEKAKEYTKYAVGQFFTPFGTYNRYEKNELNPEASVGGLLYKQFLSGSEALGTYVDPGKLQRNNVFEKSREVTEEQKQAKFDLEEAFIQSQLRNDKQMFIDAVKQSGLSQEQAKNLVESPRVQINLINEMLKLESDPMKRKDLMERKRLFEKLQIKTSLDFLPKKDRSKVLEGNQ